MFTFFVFGCKSQDYSVLIGTPAQNASMRWLWSCIIGFLRGVFTGDTCTMAEYNKLKSVLLDMQAGSRTASKQPLENPMDQRRALVDAVFKYFDLNQDGHLSGGELAQVSHCPCPRVCCRYAYLLIIITLHYYLYYTFYCALMMVCLNCTPPSIPDLHEGAFG